MQLSREVLLSLFQPYLLVNNLNPVKDLEQPLWISSSSTQKRGNKDGPGAKEEGKEELDEDAELQSPSSTLTFCNHVPSPSAFVSTLVSSSSPLQASRSVSCSRCGPAPGSESMRESVQVLWSHIVLERPFWVVFEKHAVKDESTYDFSPAPVLQRNAHRTTLIIPPASFTLYLSKTPASLNVYRCEIWPEITRQRVSVHCVHRDIIKGHTSNHNMSVTEVCPYTRHYMVLLQLLKSTTQLNVLCLSYSDPHTKRVLAVMTKVTCY